MSKSAAKAANTRESMAEEADRRRNLEGNTLFSDLGEPIQKLLLQVHNDVSDEKLKLLSKITVRQLAKVFDMLALEESPEKILAWLEREAMKAMGKEINDKKKVKSKVQTGASRDAIKFYKELEEKNVALMEKFKKSQEERDAHREANIAERKKRRAEAQARAAEERERAKERGEEVRAVDNLKKKDRDDLKGTFDRFTKQSNYDNSAAAQDTEWWKQDDYRRDFEKNGKKGKLWTRVIEGGSQAVPESEMAAREEFYRSQCWWKADKYRRDWLASRDAEWWKEESYIRDWQDNGESGRMWTAADELSGFNRKGDKRSAAHAELLRRVQWYKDNGPKGIVKAWCGLTEGSSDRCTLEEKRERDDYFKNGDWWKEDTFSRQCRENAGACDALKCAGAAGADREWWKDDTYRKDFLAGGNLWKAASAESAITGNGDVQAGEAEAEKRAEWFSNNWWKADKYLEDYRKNGPNGQVWRALNEEEATKDRPKSCKESEAKQREAWFKTADDREWWKDEAYIKDWQQNGSKGKKWNASYKEAGVAATGDHDKANDEEQKKREKWFEDNWWKQDKYTKDFQTNGSKGMSWKAAKSTADDDKDWWKSGDYQKEWSAARKADLAPFWQAPEYIEDYWKNGGNGKKWIAANAAAGSCNKGVHDGHCAFLLPAAVGSGGGGGEERLQIAVEAIRRSEGSDGHNQVFNAVDLHVGHVLIDLSAVHNLNLQIAMCPAEGVLRCASNIHVLELVELVCNGVPNQTLDVVKPHTNHFLAHYLDGGVGGSWPREPQRRETSCGWDAREVKWALSFPAAPRIRRC